MDGQTYDTPLNQVLALRAKYTVPVMAKYGDQNKHVWITEFGLPGSTTAGTPANTVSGASQATQLTVGFNYGRTSMPGVDRMFWYTFTGSNAANGSDEDFFSIIRGTPYPGGLADPWPFKPAYNALKALPK